ncbi:pyruvate formate-lyase-activating protein [Actinosynnema mirum]|uniref:Pyruvate formate-lyase-activating enzyme n=1 Tax=Actinosynnema mirum (strain ATCC 29888 / DSM 43827 / JCM 3225 / NBRC 14064 / NCIMB 13271 / NRRL B-12336 / IMRU 3971 / 101) TaxID=446462 RepID=C6WJY2_ACTMD|nr:pyruvate formate-lyase-activating protein [Actinosynnema mirum]ACU36357.1 pyruvate formate-lyase activating enzyme [Actinosynnema mirum DSM 43827]
MTSTLIGPTTTGSVHPMTTGAMQPRDGQVRGGQPRGGQVKPISGTVHSWDLATAVDGPGTRFVVFTSGCPLRCLYCQNPETWKMRDGTVVTAEEIMAEAEPYRRFIQVAGGGFTVSGGEPLLQPVFTGELFRRAKEWGMHTALDTSGYLGMRASDELLADVDLVLLDVKSWFPGTYRRVTGGEVAPTLDFARRLADLGKAVWVRFVLVPGHTDAEDNVAGVADFAASLGNVERVDVLPFHKLGESKYQELGIKFPLAGTPTPTPALVARVREQFAERGLVV